MSKLYRSLLWSGLVVAGVAACGDDVTVAPPPNAGVQSVTVGPTGVTIAVGQTLQMAAAVNADAGIATTVTWTSSNPATASVNPASGLVTGVASGSVAITACSTVATGVCGQATVTVAATTPAVISIKSITTGSTNIPVNINNVTGQIDVTLNLDAGTQTVSSVDVLIDNQVACSQGFSAIQVAAARAQAALIAGDTPNAALVVEIVCSINTMDTTAAGVPKYFNGARLVTGRVNLVGSAPVATPSTSLTFNNPSGFVVTFTTSGATANDVSGLLWTEGDITMSARGLVFIQGVTITTVTMDPDGPGGALNAKSGPSATWAKASALGNGSATYQTSAAGAAPLITGSVLSNGQPGPTLVFNAPLPLLRHDNQAPQGGTLVLTTQSATKDCCFNNWVGTAYSFAAGHAASGGGVAPTDIDANPSLNGPGVGIGATTYYFGLASATNSTLVAGTAVTTGADLAETATNTANTIASKICDLLGNCVNIRLSADGGANNATTAGVDKTAPTFVYDPTSVAADAIINPVAAVSFVSSAADAGTVGASGFGPNAVIARSFGNFTTASSANCFTPITVPIGWSGTFASGACPLAVAALTNSVTPLATFEKYFSDERNVRDEAGNKPAANLLRTVLFDQIVPTVSNVAIPPSLVGGSPATFTATAADGADLGTAAFSLEFAPFNGAQALPFSADAVISTFGLPLVTSFDATATIPFVRALEAAAPAPSGVMNPATGARFLITDVAGNFATQVNLFAVGTVPAGTSATALGVATFQVATPAAAQNVCSVATACTVASTPTSRTITVTATGPSGTFANPFTTVFLYHTTVAGAHRLVLSTNAASVTEAGGVRTWTWTFTFDALGLPNQANAPIFAIGVDAAGDGLYSVANTNLTITN